VQFQVKQRTEKHPVCQLHIRNKRHNGSQMSSLLFWLFPHSISIRGGSHYLFWLSLFDLAVTICSGRHYLLTEIEWRISQNNHDDICLPLCLIFLMPTLRIPSSDIQTFLRETALSTTSFHTVA